MSSKLESLTQEEIKQRELSAHDLWVIKLGDEVKGPYELENLKDYIQENEDLFTEAHASRLEPLAWQPLFSYPQFQRRSPQIINSSAISDGPFWLHENGLKTGPFEKFHIIKRLEMNSLIVTDKISVDDGKSWINIYEIPEFDRRDLSNLELPKSAPEQTLAQLYGKVEGEEEEEITSHQDPATDFIASSAYHGLYKNKVLPFNPAKYSVPRSENSFWSQITLPEWFLPSSVAMGLMIVGGVIFTMVSGQNDQNLSVADITENSRPLGEKRVANPSAQLDRGTRSPASVKREAPVRNRPSSLSNIRNKVPETINNHHVDRYPSNEQDPDYGHYEEPYTDPYDNPFEEDGMITHEAPPAASLIPAKKNRAVHRETASIGDVMGYEENVVDEASDF